MRGLARLPILLALLALAAPFASGEEGPVAGADAEGVDADLAALADPDPQRRREAFEAWRARGPTALPDLARCPPEAGPDLRRRIARLRATIADDWARAHLPDGMVYVPPGPLQVGERRDRADGLGRGRGWGPGATVVTVEGFYLDRHEVSEADWAAWIVSLRAARAPLPESGLSVTPSDLPVAGITWHDAERHAREARGGRLPRIEEYERAVRGDGLRAWPWGQRMLRDRANLQGLGPGRRLPVTSLPAGAAPCGALHLVGNVAEWTSTRVDFGARDHRHLVFGGAYDTPPSADLTWRRSARGAPHDGTRSPAIGFRVARDVPPLPGTDEAAGAGTGEKGVGAGIR